ncbi:beta-1,3-galactosyltransferase 5-like [Rhinoraja longicauda]
MGPMRLRTCLKAFVLALLPASAAFLVLVFRDPGRPGGRARVETPGRGGEIEGVDFAGLLSGAGEAPPCRPGQDLMVLVTSAPSNAGRREAIRGTWARRRLPGPFSWQVVFLVGRPPAGEEAAALLRAEQGEFGDLLLGGYLDTYRNLTLKVMHGLRWAAAACRPAYLLKTDDDCFVNTDRLPGFLVRDNPVRTGLYAGSLFPAERRQVIRDPSSKWYVPWRDYGREVYPPYTSGVGYVLSLDVAHALLEEAATTRPIPVEDAYVGILAQAAGVAPLASPRFAKHNVSWRVCNYRYLMVIHHLSPSQQQLAHQRMVRAWTACPHSANITTWR